MWVGENAQVTKYAYLLVPTRVQGTHVGTGLRTKVS